MSTHTVTVTEIADTTRRIARTAIQAGAAVATVCTAGVAVYQVVEPVVGAPSASNFLPWAVGAVIAVAGNAALYAKIMALPAVNELLEKINLGGQSTVASQLDTETRLLSLSAVTAAAGTATSGD